MRLSRCAPIVAGLMLTCLLSSVRAEDDKPIRALFICGGCCHDYLHQKDIIPKGISARANVEWTIAFDDTPKLGTTSEHLNPVYQNPEWYKGFDVIIHDECSSAVKDLGIIAGILKPHKDGLPGVVLHCGMHCYRSEGWKGGEPSMTPWFEFTGLQTTGHRAQKPIAVSYVDKESPIIKGLEDWTTINEELYNNIAGHVLATAHPLARGKQDYESKDKKGKVTENHFDDVVVWTNTYNGKTRVFATTLGHNNDTCADARYLDLVTRGLLWSVDKLDAAHMKPAKKVYMDGAEPKAAPPKAAGAPIGPKADANGFVPLDLARGKVASASSHQGEEHLPGAAVDGDGDTRWCAANASFPQWWQVDLGKSQNVNGCSIAWEKVNTAYRYKVEGSNDGTTWIMLSDESHSDSRDQLRQHSFQDCCGSGPVSARYVRVTVSGSATGAWASFFDFEVFGSDKVKASDQAQVKPASAEPKKAAALQTKVPPGFDLTMYAAPPHGLFTVEWGNSQIDHLPLVQSGANFKVAGPFVKFMDLPRGTDISRRQMAK
jgi:type 1 glutamine amidotransferase